MPYATARPFDPASPWNALVPSTASYTAVSGLSSLAVGFSTWLGPDAYSLPIYVASANDPLQPILYSAVAWDKVASGEWQRTNNSPTIEAQIKASAQVSFPYPGNAYSSQSATSWQLPETYDKLVNPAQGPAYAYLPSYATPNTGWDGPIAVYQPNGQVFEAFAAIRLSTGELVALNYHFTDPTDVGNGYQNGTTASMLPVYAGVIRDSEISAGHIDHAIKITVPAGLLDTSYSYPALAFDRGALTESPAYSGPLPMGARLSIPQSIELDSLGLTTPVGRMVAEAAQKYGFIIADRGGSGVTIQVESHPTSAALNAWDWGVDRDLHAIFTALKLAGNDFADTVLGGARGDVLYGGAGDDVLNGLAGNDVLYGNAGSDRFIVAKGNGSDTIADFEAGKDKVVLNSYAFGDSQAVRDALVQDGPNVILPLGNGEQLTFKNLDRSLVTSDAFSLNNASPTPDQPPPSTTPVRSEPIVAPFDLPVGAESNNWIYGTKRPDVLAGTSGRDFIDGRRGGDTMIGGAGDDTYILDNGSDRVTELSGGGVDTVKTSLSSYVLASQVENLVLLETKPHTATGNTLNNRIYASDGADVINAGPGNDMILAGQGAGVFTGGTGNDMFVFAKTGAKSTIVDFRVGEDLLDLRPLFHANGYSGTNPLADDTLHLAADGSGGTTVSVDLLHTGAFTALVKLENVLPQSLWSGSDYLWS